jgi:Asp-tRNA(Asn)/Glu-tRNA(Gln) amidotransferase A subunit family amidase
VIERAAEELAEEGAMVEERIPDVDLRHQYELGEELFASLATTFPEGPTAFSEVANVASKAEGHSSLEAYLMALGRRDETMRAWEEFFGDRDVLIVPAGTNTAERHDEETSRPVEYPYALGCLRLPDGRHPGRSRSARFTLRPADHRQALG